MECVFLIFKNMETWLERWLSDKELLAFTEEQMGDLQPLVISAPGVLVRVLMALMKHRD